MWMGALRRDSRVSSERVSASSSVSCRNPCTGPEFESAHEYGAVRCYGKAACHSQRQNLLLPLASPHIQNSEAVMNLAGWARWQLCGNPEQRPAKCVCVCTCTGVGGGGDFWSTAPQTEDIDTEREQGIGRVYMRVQQARHAFRRISGAWRLSAGLFSTLQDCSLLFRIKAIKNKTKHKNKKRFFFFFISFAA